MKSHQVQILQNIVEIISMTKCLSAGPMAAASRLMNSLTKPSRSTLPSDSPSTHEQSPGKRLPSSRRRSTSPDGPSTDSYLINTLSPPTPTTTTTSDLNQVTIEFNFPTPETIDPNFNFESTCIQLRDLAESNCQYFSQQKTDVCRRFAHLLVQLIHSLELSIPLIRYLTDHCHQFDYSPEVNNSSSTLIILFLLDLDPCQWLSNISHYSWTSMSSNIKYSSTSRYKTCWSSLQSHVFITIISRIRIVDKSIGIIRTYLSICCENDELF